MVRRACTDQAALYIIGLVLVDWRGSGCRSVSSTVLREEAQAWIDLLRLEQIEMMEVVQ